jgi:hypothetical protein
MMLVKRKRAQEDAEGGVVINTLNSPEHETGFLVSQHLDSL